MEAENEAGAPFGSGDGRTPGARLLHWRPAEAGPGESRYAAAFANAREVALDHHGEITAARSAARSAARVLLDEPAERREMLLANHPRFGAARCGGWRLAAVLLDEVEARIDEPLADRVRLAELAAGLVPEGPSGAAGDEGAAGDGPLAADTAARAWRILGDLQRRRAELAAAGESLARARRHLRRGSGDPLERAALLEATGRLLAARGRGRARAFLAGAAKLYAQLAEIDAEGRCRVRLALHVVGREPAEPGIPQQPPLSPTCLSAEEVREAVEELRFGLDLLDPDAEAELWAAGCSRLRQLSAESALENGMALAACARTEAPLAPGCNELA